MNLKCFTQPEILQQIGSRRLEKLFGAFREDLESEHLVLPTPESQNGIYFDSLATTLASETKLPGRLQNTLLTIEAVASPENRPQLDSAIQRTIPTVAVSQTCVLDRALELWFHAPEELSSFSPPNHRNTEEPPTEAPLLGPACQDVSVSDLEAAPSSTLLAPSSESAAFKPIFDPQSSILNPSSCAPLPEAPSATELPEKRNTETLEYRNTEPPPSDISASQHVSVSDFTQNSTLHSVDGSALLHQLADLLKRSVILPQWAAETIALWILHTYAFHLRDITAYIGIESPEKRCGKTTLLTLLNELAHRAIASSNISPPAFFRVIEDLSPTLLIDEVDTFLTGNDQLRGILNAGYHRKTAFVLRATNSPRSSENSQQSTNDYQLARFSCWCPKALAKIGRFPDTLADRCIIIRMQRKTSAEKCDRSRDLDAGPLKQQCLRFVADHAAEIAAAKPQLPPELNDRAADIWEPLLVLADLAGGDWPKLARQAAIGLSASAQESSPIGSLLLDIFFLFTIDKVDRMFTHTLVAGLNVLGSRPWKEPLKGKEATDLWLAQQLRPYGIKPKTLRIGDKILKGYLYADMLETFHRYIPKSDLKAPLSENTPEFESNPGSRNDDPNDGSQSAAA